MSAPILDEAWLKQHIWPRFSRVLARQEIYLANHSLGRPPDRVADDVRDTVDAWYRDLDGAWKLWLEGREKFRSLTASRTQGIPYWGSGQFYLEGMKRMVEVQRMVGALSGEVDLAKMIDTRFLPDDIKTPK